LREPWRNASRTRTSRATRSTPIAHAITVTYKGTCTVNDDEATKSWFYPALVDVIRPQESAEYERHSVSVLDSPRRVVLEVTPTQRIGYDGVKMHRATMDAFSTAPQGQ